MANTKTHTDSKPFSFNLELEEGITIPDDLSTTSSRPNVIVDLFLTPGLTKVMADEKAEPTMFFPLAFFQDASDNWAKSQGKEAKKLTIGDARQKLNDKFKTFQEKNPKASIVEMLLANRTGKEGDAKATEPGVRVWLRMKKK